MLEVKNAIYHILVLTYLGHLFMPLYVVADYEVRKEYIATVLCENKSTPELHCNGKCYLSKKLSKLQHDQEEQQQQRIKLVTSQSDYIPSDAMSFMSVVTITLSGWSVPSNQGLYDFGFISTTFKPPQTAV